MRNDSLTASKTNYESSSRTWTPHNMLREQRPAEKHLSKHWKSQIPDALPAAQFSFAASGESSPSLRSASNIIATNASPLSNSGSDEIFSTDKSGRAFLTGSKTGTDDTICANAILVGAPQIRGFRGCGERI